MANAFNSAYWRAHGGVLPGWIVGTAGAARPSLPKNFRTAGSEVRRSYGYLLGTVNPPGSPAGSIEFEFHAIRESDVSSGVVQKHGRALVHWCFAEN